MRELGLLVRPRTVETQLGFVQNSPLCCLLHITHRFVSKLVSITTGGWTKVGVALVQESRTKGIRYKRSHIYGQMMLQLVRILHGKKVVSKCLPIGRSRLGPATIVRGYLRSFGGWAPNGVPNFQARWRSLYPRSARTASAHGSSHALEKTGLFDKPLLNRPEGFAEATQQALRKAKELVLDIRSLADRPSVSIVMKMDELSDTLCQVADLAECIRLVHPDPAMIEAAQSACLVINNYVEELNTDTRLHRSLDNLMKTPEYAHFDRVTQRTTELLMHDFESSGIHLEERKREKVVDLNSRILQLGHQFVSNASLPILVPKRQCPTVLQKYFRMQNSHTVVDHVPYYSSDSQLRSLSYRLYYTDIPQQQEVLEQMLELRHQLATATGYPTFAHRVLRTCMAEYPDVVREFLEALSERILPLAREEVEEMIGLKRNFGNQFDSHTLRPWDVAFCSSLAESHHFPVRTSDIQEYFVIKNCLTGLDSLFHSLFDVQLQQVPTKPGEVWDAGVMKLAFVHDMEGLLGYTYCDLIGRAGKTISDCHFTIQGGRETEDGGYQTPVIALCCNFPQRGSEGSVLLSQQAVENLFHEMGHALHSMLGRPKYQNVTGTRCSTDFAEVPSTLMEYFLNDERVLASFAHHYKTGRPIPKSHLSTFKLSSKLFPAFDAQIQIVYAMPDLTLHGPHPLGKSCVQLATDIYRQYAPLDPVPGVTWCLRFNHFYGYGARYYSYLWSRAVSSLIWTNCFKHDPFSRESGERLRTMLKYGGGLPAKRLVHDMLGFEPTITDLVEALCHDITEHRQRMKDIHDSKLTR